MHKPCVFQVDLLRKSLGVELRASASARFLHKLHCVLLVTNGMSSCGVADKFGESARSVQRWVKAFEAGGIETLRDEPHTGRTSRLPASCLELLLSDLRSLPTTLGYSEACWTGILVAKHLALRYDVCLGTRQCQRLLASLHLP